MQGEDLASEKGQGAPTVSQPQSVERNEFVLTPGDFRKIVFKRRFVILGFLAVGLLIGATITFLATPIYEAVCRVDINPSRSTNIGISDIIGSKTGGGEAGSTRLLTEVRILQSDTVIESVIQSQKVFAREPFSKVFQKSPYSPEKGLTPLQRFSLIRIFRGNLQVMSIPNTDLVEIHYRDPSPAQAEKIANAVVDQYMELDLRSRYDGTLRVSNWLSGQMGELKAHAAEAQRKLAQFQRANNLIGIDADGSSLVSDTLRIVNEQLNQAQADRIVKEARYRLAQTRNPELLVSVAPTTTLATLRSQQAQLLVEAAQLKSKYGADYPRVREVEKQLAAVQVDIDGEINNLLQRFEEEYNAAVNTQALLQNQLDKEKSEAFRVSDSSADYEILKREAESTADLYDALQMKLKEASVTAGLNSNNVNIVDHAAVPALPVSPSKRKNYGYGGLIGLLLGIATAIALESMDDTVQTSEDAESIANLPALAVVPRFSSVGKSAKGRPTEPAQTAAAAFAPELVSLSAPQSISAEAFRTLRSSILMSSADSPARLILITSSFAAEGKSTIAANLALSFARRDAKVLLVDTDLRRGTLHLKFRVPNREGLSTLLVRSSGESAYQTPLPDMPNFFLLPRGPIAPNPGEILASHHMEALLEQWKIEFDHVILDSAPILPVADTLSLAPLADSTVLVVRAATTRKKALLRMRALLRRAQARIVGIVVNDIDLRLENYYTYSTKYGYDYTSNYGSGYGATEDEK